MLPRNVVVQLILNRMHVIGMSLILIVPNYEQVTFLGMA